jgi:phosphate transport system substrate-binding protein
MTKRKWLASGAVALLATIGVGVGAAGTASAAPSLLGGGSGFAALEIDQWRADVARSPYNLSINYQAQGSSFGRQQFTQGVFDYGASDIQYMQAEVGDLQGRRCGGKPLAQCFVYVPVSAGGLAFMYNLRDGSGRQVNDLKLTRQSACKIFTGAITKWNDPELVRSNPRLAGVPGDIRPVVRADGAGESFVFSEFCIAVAPAVWSAFVQQQKASGNGNLSVEFAAGQATSLWPADNWGANPVAVPFADGTANYVADPTSGEGTMTYVAAGYAKVRNFPTASVQNAAGVFTQPDETNVTVALGYASPRGNGTFQLRFSGNDPRAYFPSTYSYILAQTAGYDRGKGAVLAQFLCYAVSKGQAIAPTLRYARLSSVLENIAIDAIVQIPGAPAKANCPVAGAPRPPPPPVLIGGGGGGPGATTGPSNATGSTSGTTTDSTSPAAKARRAAALVAAAKKQAAKEQKLRTASLDRELAEAAASRRQPESGWHVSRFWALGTGGPLPFALTFVPWSPIWVLLAGVLLAWGITFAWSRRRATS